MVSRGINYSLVGFRDFLTCKFSIEEVFTYMEIPSMIWQRVTAETNGLEKLPVLVNI